MKRNGMLTALMEEYKRVLLDYKVVLKTISDSEYIIVRDKITPDEDCKSIQTVTFHVVQSGYTYANYIQSVSKEKWLEYGEEIHTTEKAIKELDKMWKYSYESFGEHWFKTNKQLKEYSFKTRWNVTYDLEQLLEHAIVHILRHRRQIEIFLKND